MIGKLKGVVEDIASDHALIDVGGVCYIAACSAKTLSQLPGPGGRVSLLTEMITVQEQTRLYGFGSPEERDWFRLLQTVQGVGARVALSILSVLEPADIHRAVVFGDKAQVARAPGVGPKLAQRIVTELKDKAAQMGAPAQHGSSSADLARPQPLGAAAEAMSALTNLGYAPAEAHRAIAAAIAEFGPDVPLGTLIKAALGQLAMRAA